MVVQDQEELGEGSAMPTDPHHTAIITQPSSSQPKRKQKSRRLKRKDTENPQSSVPSDPTNVADETVNEEPSMQLNELMDFCTKLQQRVLDLENTKTAQAQEITSLKLRVKRTYGNMCLSGGLWWRVVVAWQFRGVFGSLDPKILTTPPL
ncbi:hypothetical protein Tco_0007521 [Tanacetum coccineum]